MKKILLAVTGGIAAYKSCEIVRLLRRAGHEVRVAMTPAAGRFVGADTFHALSGHPVLREPGDDALGMAHIEAGRRADAILIAPATADTIAKIVCGIADNIVTALVAARDRPVALAPAMNVCMWRNPANQRNIGQLLDDGITVFMPETGSLACGEEGEGRMAQPSHIVDLLEDLFAPKILAGKKVLITLGGTREFIDPVRVLTNLSGGRMGAALARACRAAGAEVTLVAGEVKTELPVGMKEIVRVSDAREMCAAVNARAGDADVFIAVAAVADYRVADSSAHKLKKSGMGDNPVLRLVENPDILATVAALPDPPYCVGFAAETERLAEYARAKKIKKNVPMLVANLVSEAMGGDNTRILILDGASETPLPEMPKIEAARIIVRRLADALSAGATSATTE